MTMSNPENSTDTSANTRPRRGSMTSQTFNNIFGPRSNSTAGLPTAPFPGPITSAAAKDQRRRMSISTIGLSGTSPTQTSPFPFSNRRSSVSTAGSESIDENAIDDDDGPSRSQPATPFARRMSFGAQALRTVRGGTGNSPTAAGEGGFNWSEQLRSRAESSVSQQQRPNFSMTTSNVKTMQLPHERTKSVSEMPTPPTATIPAPAQPRPIKKPDAFQERILKGDFYMD